MKKLLFFKKEHKFLFFSLILSSVVAIGFFIFLCIALFEKFNYVTTFLLLLFPVFLIALVSFVACKTFSKHSKITRIISGVLTGFIIFFQILFYIVLHACIILFLDATFDCNNPSDYKTAINTGHKPGCIKHFPKSIPNNAKNIKFKRTYNNRFGSEEIYLKFDIDKDYINKELKKHKFNYKENVETDYQRPSLFRHHSSVLVAVDIDYEKNKDYTFYIIHDKKSENPPQNTFLYYYGIAANDKKTTIVYFYVNPD